MLALHTACLDSIPETSVPTYLSLLKVRWWKLELPPCKGCWVQNGVAAALCFCETRTGAWICWPGSFLSFSPDSSFLLLLNSGEHPSLLNCLLCKILEGLFLRHCMYEMSLLNHVPRSLAGYGILVYKHLFQELQKDWYTVHFTAPVKTVTVSWFLLSCLCIWGVCMSRAHTSPWVHTLHVEGRWNCWGSSPRAICLFPWRHFLPKLEPGLFGQAGSYSHQGAMVQAFIRGTSNQQPLPCLFVSSV